MEQLLDAVEEEWEIVPTTWWHTSYSNVSWSYPGQNSVAPYIAGPPYYHDALQTLGSSSSSHSFSELGQLCDHGEHSDILLNPDLVGVCAALSVLSTYESGVGFFAFDTPRAERDDYHWNDVSIPQELPQSNTGQCDTGFDDTAGACVDFDNESIPLYSSGSQSLSSSISELRTSTDFTESGGWIIPVPLPSPTKTKTMPTKNRSTSSTSLSSRPLNASASAFIPSSTNIKSCKLSDTVESPGSISVLPLPYQFGLPNLISTNTSAPVIKIEKDEQGFYTGVETLSKSSAPPPRPSSALLPPFLQEPSRRKGSLSKTRSIVDRLRSSHYSYDTADATGDSQSIKGQTVSHSPSPSPTFHDLGFFQRRVSVSEDGWDCERVSSPSANDDEDGWIGVDASVKPGDNAIKAKRTRDLFLALTRRRSDPWEAAKTDGGGSTFDTELSSNPSSPSPSNDNNGWIEGPLTSPLPHTQANHVPEPPSRSNSRPSSQRGHSTTPSLTSTQSLAARFPIHSNIPQSPLFSSTHAPYFYAPRPPVSVPIPYATYVQMQAQLRLQLQLQAVGVASGLPFPNPAFQGHVPPGTRSGGHSPKDLVAENMLMNANALPASRMRRTSLW